MQRQTKQQRLQASSMLYTYISSWKEGRRSEQRQERSNSSSRWSSHPILITRHSCSSPSTAGSRISHCVQAQTAGFLRLLFRAIGPGYAASSSWLLEIVASFAQLLTLAVPRQLIGPEQGTRDCKLPGVMTAPLDKLFGVFQMFCTPRLYVTGSLRYVIMKSFDWSNVRAAPGDWLSAAP